MQKLKLTVPWKCGLHLRPASHLSNLLRKTGCTVMIGTKEKMVKGTRLIDVIELGIRQGEEVIIEIEGKNEKEAAEKIKEFFMIST